MEKIKRLDLTDYERLERVRDLLLFQASVGTAYCDLVNFDVNSLFYTLSQIDSGQNDYFFWTFSMRFVQYFA